QDLTLESDSLPVVIRPRVPIWIDDFGGTMRPLRLIARSRIRVEPFGRSELKLILHAGGRFNGAGEVAVSVAAKGGGRSRSAFTRENNSDRLCRRRPYSKMDLSLSYELSAYWEPSLREN